VGPLSQGQRAALAVLACAVAAAVLAPAAAQPAVPKDPGSILGPVVGPVVTGAVPPTEVATRQDLHDEDVRVHIGLTVGNVDYQLLGILFGGGKVAADATAQVRFEFRAISLTRLDDALRASTGDANASVARTFGIPADRLALAAEEVRTAGTGQLLPLFQSYEATAAQRTIEDAIPGLDVSEVRLAWSNLQPAAAFRTPLPNGTPFPDPVAAVSDAFLPDLREPPIVLTATVKMAYLHRTNLVELVQGASQSSPEQQRLDRLKDAIEANETEPIADRTAFDLLGFTQLVTLGAPPGWRIDVDLQVPQGFTVEGATRALEVAPDRRLVSTQMDGLARSRPANEQGVVTISSRGLVTAAILAAAALVGYKARLPLEVLALSVSQRGAKRRGEQAPPPRLVRWPGSSLVRKR